MDSPLPHSMSAHQVLDREYLEIRAKLLEVAASLDRIDRGAGTVHEETRMHQFRDALKMILTSEGDRAKQLQMIFSRPYDADWRESLPLSSS